MNAKQEFPLDFSIQLAQRQVEAYGAQDELMAKHHQAMKCCDCEEFGRWNSGVQTTKAGRGDGT